MTSTPNRRSPGTPTDEFERALTALVLESFAKGARVQGTWQITPPSTLVPNWKITIEKTDAAETLSDQPTFLDE